MAIAGQGFFAVSQATSDVNNVPDVHPSKLYAGRRFHHERRRLILVNSAGNYLNGWSVDRRPARLNALMPI